MREDSETSGATSDSLRVMKDAQETLEQSFTPSLARRLSRQFIEQTRQSLPRSPSIPREKFYRSTADESTENINNNEKNRPASSSTISDQTEYRSRSCDRGVRQTNSLLENNDRSNRFEHRSTRRSVSLFDDEDEPLPPLPRQIMTLGRKYRDTTKPGPSGALRRDSFHNYKTEKIQEEPPDEFSNCSKATSVRSDFASTPDCSSANNSNTNLGDTRSSLSAKSCEDSPTDTSSNHGDYSVSPYKPDTSGDFENRLLAAENLIKESKLRNLGPVKFDLNLTSSYKETDKCDKALLGSMTDVTSGMGKRRSCIPSLRRRSGSLTREASASRERRKTLSCTQDAVESPHGPTPERSILSKFFRAGSGGRYQDTNEKLLKEKGPRRISRFLRPDFFDTPREESRYVKEKEAQKAAENERRKSRFTRKKNDVKAHEDAIEQDEKPEKELKNEANAITRDKTESLPKDNKSENGASTVSGQNSEAGKFERQSSKSSFLQSLEKKLEKFRSSDDGLKLTNGNGVLVDHKPRENSAPPVHCPENEGGPMKRAVSVEDLPICDAASPSMASKCRVSSVLGLFKNESSKASCAGQRPQSTILSKFKKNSYKGSRSDSVLGTEQIPSTSSGSKIPTKFAKTEAESSKKISENKKSPDKVTAERIKSPSTEGSKERSPPDRSSSKKSGSVEKQAKPLKKNSPEKLMEGKTDKPEKFSSSKEQTQKQSTTPEKSAYNRSSIVSRLAVSKKSSPEKTTDNKQMEVTSGEAEEKRVVKVKRNVKSLASLVKNGSVSKVARGEEGEKKLKKVTKRKDAIDKETTDGMRKEKEVIRIVKKTVKKSDSSDSKSDEKEKITKTLMKKTTSAAKKDSSPEIIGKSKDKSQESSSRRKGDSPDTKMSDTVVEPKDTNYSSSCTVPNTDDALISLTTLKKSKENCFDTLKSEAVRSVQSSEAAASGDPESMSNLSIPNNVQKSDSDCKNLPAGLGTAKSNRSNLKLDLSKIPQHSFKGVASKKDYAKVEPSSSKFIAIAAKITQSESPPMSRELVGKVSESLSKMTHHANVTGSKIVIDKTLRARDVEDLQRESTEPKVYGSFEKIISPASYKEDKSGGLAETVNSKSECKKEIDVSSIQSRPTNLPLEGAAARRSSSPRINEAINDYTDDIFSPVDDNESFDSWSLCSADLNHMHDVHSPTSPTYSPLSRGDHPESIIDRIRRKSFYSRFNERKRKSSLNVPSPGIIHPAGSTLPRKYSFNSSREKDYRKPSMYASTARRHPERSYSLYNEEPPNYRKSPVDRYFDVGSIGSFSGDLQSPSDQYNSLGSGYDPLRRYRVTPSPDSMSRHRRYQSTDYGLDSDAGSYRSPMSPTNRPIGLVKEVPLDSYSGPSMMPRKYGSVSSCPEAKSADYYEELLAPTRSDYLSSRKTPVPGDYFSRHENGYHNGNFNLQPLDADKWKIYSEKMESLDVTDGGDERLEKQTRCAIWKNNESQDLAASRLETDPTTSKAE